MNAIAARLGRAGLCAGLMFSLAAAAAEAPPGADAVAAGAAQPAAEAAPVDAPPPPGVRAVNDRELMPASSPRATG